MKDNELIAEFMDEEFIREKNWHRIHWKDMPFNTSWDWLMPVVDKINKIGVWTLRPGFAMVQNPEGELRPEKKFKFIKSDSDFEEIDGNSVDWIVIVHSVAVKFIKWYNQTKP